LFDASLAEITPSLTELVKILHEAILSKRRDFEVFHDVLIGANPTQFDANQVRKPD
jgi:hypothetical protein